MGYDLKLVAHFGRMAKIRSVKNHDKAEKVFTPQRQRNVSRHENRRATQASYTATEAKNEFGRLLEQAIQGTTVLITKHDSPRAVPMRLDERLDYAFAFLFLVRATRSGTNSNLVMMD